MITSMSLAGSILAGQKPLHLSTTLFDQSPFIIHVLIPALYI